MSVFNSLSAPSLRTKLVSIALITTGLTVLISNLALIMMEYHLIRDDIHDKLSILSNIIANRADEALLNQQPELLIENLDSLQSDDSVVRSCIYDYQQSLVAAYHSQPSEHTCSESLTSLVPLSNLNFSLSTPILDQGQQIGTLYLEADNRVLLYRINRFLLFSLVVVTIASILAFFLAGQLKSLVIRPLKNLNITLHNILRNKDYSIRASKHEHDEMGELVDVFNTLLNTVQDEHESLRSSEERFRILTALAPVGIFQTDIHQQLVYVNQHWRDLMGIEGSLPEVSQWQERVHIEDLPALRKCWVRLRDHNERFTIELRLANSIGRYIWVQLLVGPLHTNGSHSGYLGAVLDISELKMAQLQLEQLAFYDPLTNLANRRLFRDRLEQAIAHVKRTQTNSALLFLDMDQFKRINDTMGHDAGDVLLREVSKRLISVVRETDTVSRIGGDEFTILLNDISNTNDVHNIADKLLKSLARPIRIKGQDIHATVSIGITLLPDDSLDVNTLMKNADMAMYRAKELGRNNFQFFSDELNRSVLDFLTMEKELNEAITKKQFSLVFQPKININQKRLTGLECLIRWQHPVKGMIPPDRFIPIAEETGQIIEIGNWVLEECCREVAQLLRTNVLAHDVKVAVNLSARQFNNPMLAEHIQNVLNETGMPASCLEIELTESTLMDDIERTVLTMQKIKTMGVSIAIDDFGTGYSSLAYIKRFPIDVLKVDRSFVMDIPGDKNDMAITAAVIAMAHKLSLKVVAEGVETDEQLDFLHQNHCDEGQGYLFSRPLPMEQLLTFLQLALVEKTSN